jgi:hypothetical protein
VDCTNDDFEQSCIQPFIMQRDLPGRMPVKHSFVETTHYSAPRELCLPSAGPRTFYVVQRDLHRQESQVCAF